MLSSISLTSPSTFSFLMLLIRKEKIPVDGALEKYLPYVFCVLLKMTERGNTAAAGAPDAVWVAS